MTDSEHHGSREQGFSLVEVIVAAIILAIVSGAIAGAVMQSSSVDSRSRTSSQLQSAADAVSERLREDSGWMRSCTMAVTAREVDCSSQLQDALGGDELDDVLEYWSTGENALRDDAVLRAELTAVGHDSTSDGLGDRDTDGRRPDYFRSNVEIYATFPSGHERAGARMDSISTVVGTVVTSPWRSADTGSILFQACEVGTQSDERTSIGSCDTQRTEQLPTGTSGCTRFDLQAWCAAPVATKSWSVRPMPSTAVRLRASGSPTIVATGTTDANGFAIFPDLTPGTYTAELAAPAALQLWADKSSPGSAGPCSDLLQIGVQRAQQANAVAVLRERVQRGDCAGPSQQVPTRLATTPHVNDNPSDTSSYSRDGGFWLRLAAAPFGREKFESATDLQARGATPASGGWSWICQRTRNYSNWLFLPYCGAHPTERHIHDDMHPVWQWHTYRPWYRVITHERWAVPRYAAVLNTPGIWIAQWRHQHFDPAGSTKRWHRKIGSCNCYTTNSALADWHHFPVKLNDAVRWQNTYTGAGGHSAGPAGNGNFVPTTDLAKTSWLWNGACRTGGPYSVGGTGSCANDAWAPNGTWHTVAHWLYNDALCGGFTNAECGRQDYEGTDWRDNANPAQYVTWQYQHNDNYDYVRADYYSPSCTPQTWSHDENTWTTLNGSYPRTDVVRHYWETTCTLDPNVYDFPRTTWRRSPMRYWGGSLTGPAGRHPHCANAANAAIPMSHCTQPVESSICPRQHRRYPIGNAITGHVGNYEPWCARSFNAALGAFHHVTNETKTNAQHRESTSLPRFESGLYAGYLLKQTPAGTMSAVPINGHSFLSWPGGPTSLNATTEGADTAVPFGKDTERDAL